MKTITRYKCEVCGTEWESKAMAAACEAYALPPCPVVPGQTVKVFERYEAPETDTVLSVRVAPSFMVAWGSLHSWEPDYGEGALDELRSRGIKPQFHEWRVKVGKSHQMNKDGDMADEVALGDIMVDGKWLSEARLTVMEG